MTHPAALTRALNRFFLGGVCAALASGALIVAGASSSPDATLRSYLVAYIFWFNFTLGCLGLLMLHHMTSGGWGFMIQRLLEAGAETAPVMAILFLPLLLGVGMLYPWAQGGASLSVQIWSAYLNVPFFVVRSVAYFAIWMAGAALLGTWSRRQDASGDPRLTRRIRMLSAPGLVLYVLTLTLASVDWLMSLEPGWFSTIYGFLFVVNQVLSALALAVLALRALGRYPPLSGLVTPVRSRHLGNMLLTFVILWAYCAYSQFIIIWSGDLPEENSWYLHRMAGGWSEIALVVIVLHFFVPFFLLLFRRIKRLPGSLTLVAALLVVMRFIDNYWLIVPSFAPSGVHAGWRDIAAPVALGGAWLAAYARGLKRSALVPQRDPRFPLPAAAPGGG